MSKIGIFIDKNCDGIKWELYNPNDSDKYVRVVRINEQFPVLNCYYRDGIVDWDYKLSMTDALDAPKMLERLNKVADDLISNWESDIPDGEFDKSDFYICIDVYKIINDDGLHRLIPVIPISYELN
jgi:hypothetical protein